MTVLLDGPRYRGASILHFSQIEDDVSRIDKLQLFGFRTSEFQTCDHDL